MLTQSELFELSKLCKNNQESMDRWSFAKLKSESVQINRALVVNWLNFFGTMYPPLETIINEWTKAANEYFPTLMVPFTLRDGLLTLSFTQETIDKDVKDIILYCYPVINKIGSINFIVNNDLSAVIVRCKNLFNITIKPRHGGIFDCQSVKETINVLKRELNHG